MICHLFNKNFVYYIVKILSFFQGTLKSHPIFPDIIDLIHLFSFRNLYPAVEVNLQQNLQIP